MFSAVSHWTWTERKVFCNPQESLLFESLDPAPPYLWASPACDESPGVQVRCWNLMASGSTFWSLRLFSGTTFLCYPRQAILKASAMNMLLDFILQYAPVKWLLPSAYLQVPLWSAGLLPKPTSRALGLEPCWYSHEAAYTTHLGKGTEQAWEQCQGMGGADWYVHTFCMEKWDSSKPSASPRSKLLNILETTSAYLRDDLDDTWSSPTRVERQTSQFTGGSWTRGVSAGCCVSRILKLLQLIRKYCPNETATGMKWG